MFKFLKNIFKPKREEVPVIYKLTREEKRDAINKGTFNFISSFQIQQVIAKNKDPDFLDLEVQELMNEPNLEYIAYRVMLEPELRDRERKFIDPVDIVVGSIVGDIIGSRYEFTEHDYRQALHEDLPPKRSLFTDDTILSIATMKAVLENSIQPDFRQHYIDAYMKYPRAGYGSSFVDWAIGNIDNTKGYHSMANGAAMRLSFIPAYYDDYVLMLEYTAASTMTTHNHVEAVKHSLILSTCIWMALHNYNKEEIRRYCDQHFYYTEEQREDLFYKYYQFPWETPLSELSNEQTRKTLFANYAVPFAIKCFLETDSYIDCMREILSHYGDTDTICAIAGGLCMAYYETTGLDTEKILREAQVPEIDFKV